MSYKAEFDKATSRRDVYRHLAHFAAWSRRGVVQHEPFLPVMHTMSLQLDAMCCDIAELHK